MRVNKAKDRRGNVGISRKVRWGWGRQTKERQKTKEWERNGEGTGEALACI